jgi:signal transduction histidine kinase
MHRQAAARGAGAAGASREHKNGSGMPRMRFRPGDPSEGRPDPATPIRRAVRRPGSAEAARALQDGLAGQGPGELADRAPARPVPTAALPGVLAALGRPLCVVDGHWRLRHLNAAAAALWKPGQARPGRSLWTLMPRAVGTEGYEQLRQALRDGAPVRTTLPGPVPGSTLLVEGWPHEDGLVLLAGTADAPDPAATAAAPPAATDAAEPAEADLRRRARRLARALRRARAVAVAAQAEAQGAARTKTEFLANMSHELRTPLNAISGYAQLLELGVAGPVTDRQRDYLARLQASNRHLRALVDDVLDLARMDAGRLAVVRQRLDTTSVLQGVAALVARRAAAQGVHLSVTMAPLSVVGDEHRVRQVLLNLLANAVKFTPAGGQVTVTAVAVPAAGPPEARLPDAPDAARGWVALQVADTGIGIAPEQQARIFEPFVQVDASRTRTSGGPGLGLAVARRLAELMDGALTVRSAPGAGATFTLWLPAADPAA